MARDEYFLIAMQLNGVYASRVGQGGEALMRVYPDIALIEIFVPGRNLEFAF
jgi:hypothetical protein